jgi:hypothetical protein
VDRRLENGRAGPFIIESAATHRQVVGQAGLMIFDTRGWTPSTWANAGSHRPARAWMGLDAGPLGPRICDRSSRGHPGMGTRVSIHRTACLSDLVRQRPLSAGRGETRGDTYRNRHPCAFGAENGRLETSARRLTRKTNSACSSPDRQLCQPHLHRVPPGDIPEYWPKAKRLLCRSERRLARAHYRDRREKACGPAGCHRRLGDG